MNEFDEENYELVNNSSKPYFMFLSDAVLYAIDADNVLEIIENQSVTKVPLMQEFIWGVTNVRGNIIPVVDLKGRVLGDITQINPKTSFVLIKYEIENQILTIAIVIDEICEVDGLDPNSSSETPAFGTIIDPRYIDFIARYNGADVLILKLEELLELNQINTLIEPDYTNPNEYKLEAKQRSNIWLEDELDEDEDLDIVNLLSSNGNDTNQYLVFQGPHQQYYAKNVSKIEEVISMDELSIQKNFDEHVIVGISNIRGEMLSIVSFDDWLGDTNADHTKYSQVIISNYGKQKFGLAVKQTEFIVTINPKDMIKSADGDLKSTFVSNIDLDGENVVCTIVDSDMITMNAFKTLEQQVENDILLTYDTINSDQFIYFADDSMLVRNLLIKSVTKMNAKCKIFENGQQLLEALNEADIDSIGLIITDLEMPVLDGKELIKQLRANEKFKDTGIVVYTNMANSILKEQLLNLGANEVQTKIDFSSLNALIKKYMS
jgi:chemotaxis signal transduction protein/CheY-like chemotaxis protein